MIPRSTKVYVASSWRNSLQQTVVSVLRGARYQVYDFRHPHLPRPKDTGFSWEQIGRSRNDNPEFSPEEWRTALLHSAAEAGFRSDKAGLEWADTCVLVMPCGRSAHIAAGWMAGQGKRVIPFVTEYTEPDLMYKLFDPIVSSFEELLLALEAEAS